jgi:riboflavin transporter FmnP
MFLASMLNLIALLPAYSKVFGFKICVYGSIFAMTSSTDARR